MAPKTVLVTGASRGIGLELVKQLLTSEPSPEVVFAACRDPSSASELQKLQAKHTSLRVLSLDVRDDASITSAARQVAERLGDLGLHALVNNAGVFAKDWRALEDQTRAQMQDTLDTNVTGPLLVIQRFLPLLRKAAQCASAKGMTWERAAIINVSSDFSSIASVGQRTGDYHYRCSKAALNMATALMANEVRSAGVLAVGIHPGWVRTDMGGVEAPLTPQQSVGNMLHTLSTLTEESSGLLLDHSGDLMPF